MSAAQTVGTATLSAKPIKGAPSPHHFDPGQHAPETKRPDAGVVHLSSGAVGGPQPKLRAPRWTPYPVGHSAAGTNSRPADGTPFHPGQWVGETQASVAGVGE